MNNRLFFFAKTCFVACCFILFLMMFHKCCLMYQFIKNNQVANPNDFNVCFTVIEQNIQRGIEVNCITFWKEDEHIHIENPTERTSLSTMFHLKSIDSVYWNMQVAPSMELNRKLEITPYITIEWGVLNDEIPTSQNEITCQIHIVNQVNINFNLTIYTTIPAEFARKLERLDF